MSKSQKITNRRTVKQTDNDYYRTPVWATKALFYYENFQGYVVDPCCGAGEMTEVIKRYCYNVKASDLIDRGYGRVEDYLKFEGINHNIVMNPPYDLAANFIHKALKTTTNKVCALLRLGFLESQSRYYDIYRYTPPTRIRVFSERVSMYKGDCERTDGGTTAYAWYIFDNTKPVETTELSWIKPGFKNGTTKRFIYGKKEHRVL